MVEAARLRASGFFSDPACSLVARTAGATDRCGLGLRNFWLERAGGHIACRCRSRKRRMLISARFHKRIEEHRVQAPPPGEFPAPLAQKSESKRGKLLNILEKVSRKMLVRRGDRHQNQRSPAHP